MFNESSLNSGHIEKKISRKRVTIMAGIILLLIGIILARFYYLQITLNSNFTTLSDQNRVHGRSIAPLRGLITDRNGIVLAQNVPSFELNIIPEHSTNIKQLVTHIRQIIKISDDEVEEFWQHLNRFKSLPYQRVPLKFQLSEQEVAILAINEYRLPGMEVQATLARNYPFKEQMSHVLGYVGRINLQEQKTLDKQRYEGTHLIGKIGIEKQYESELLGHLGYESVETNVSGRVLRSIERQIAEQGSEIQLYLDAELQQVIHKQMENRRGAAVAISVKTGGILAMVSMPTFDSNPFVTGISHKAYQNILSNPDKPLLNRALLGQYPPGSIIKPTFALSALQAGTITEQTKIKDNGYIQIPGNGRKYRDWKRAGHGIVNLRQSIAQSCDVFFYELGLKTGITTLSKTANQLNIGLPTGIDMPQEKPGLMPTPKIKKWSDGETVNTSIGQGDMLVTPLQMAQNTAIIARKGVVIPPKMIKRIDGKTIDNIVSNTIEIEDRHWQLVHQSMIDVVHHYKGTAASLNRKTTFKIASKTGTAQVVSIEQDKEYDSEQLTERQRDHAWFIAFAPVDNPSIAIAVIVENGETSTKSAGLVAVAAINHWLSKTQRTAMSQQAAINE